MEFIIESGEIQYILEFHYTFSKDFWYLVRIFSQSSKNGYLESSESIFEVKYSFILSKILIWKYFFIPFTDSETKCLNGIENPLDMLTGIWKSFEFHLVYKKVPQPSPSNYTAKKISGKIAQFCASYFRCTIDVFKHISLLMQFLCIFKLDL